MGKPKYLDYYTPHIQEAETLEALQTNPSGFVNYDQLP